MSGPIARTGHLPMLLGPVLRRIERLDERMVLIFQRQPTRHDWATLGTTILPQSPEVPSRDIEILTHLHAASVVRVWIENHAALLHHSRLNNWSPQSQAHWQAVLSRDYRAWLDSRAVWSRYDFDFNDESASYLSTLGKIEETVEWWIASGAAEWSVAGGAVWAPFDTNAPQ